MVCEAVIDADHESNRFALSARNLSVSPYWICIRLVLFRVSIIAKSWIMFTDTMRSSFTVSPDLNGHVIREWLTRIGYSGSRLPELKSPAACVVKGLELGLIFINDCGVCTK